MLRKMADFNMLPTVSAKQIANAADEVILQLAKAGARGLCSPAGGFWKTVVFPRPLAGFPDGPSCCSVSALKGTGPRP
jgi:hypothetical protein